MRGCRANGLDVGCVAALFLLAVLVVSPAEMGFVPPLLLPLSSSLRLGQH